MRVIHSAPPLGPSQGGLYEAVRRLSHEQAHCGIEVKVRTPWSYEASLHQDDWNPVNVEISGRIRFAPAGWSPTFGEELRQEDADLLHTHGLWLHPSWCALNWKKKFRRPHVASVHGMLEPWSWNHRRWKKRPVWWLLEKRNLESASLLIATSVQEAQALRDRKLTAPIAVIPNGVDLPTLNEAAAGLDPSLRAQGPRTLLFLGRLHPKKGLPLLLEAWAKVNPPGWVLEIAGPDEGGHRAELERQVAASGLTGRVHFCGPLAGDDKERAFSRASIFVLATHSENFGIAVAEAMARRLPVITTHGAPWQCLESEACGWWVPVSVDGIAGALEDATARSADDLATMGAKGRTLVEDRFTWPKVAAQMKEVYEWMVGGGEKPGSLS